MLFLHISLALSVEFIHKILTSKNYYNFFSLEVDDRLLLLSLPSFILYFNTYISGGFNKLEIELCEQTKYLLEIKYFKKSGDC